MADLAPLHPGEVLREEFLVPMKLSAYALADHCMYPAPGLSALSMSKTALLPTRHCG